MANRILPRHDKQSPVLFITLSDVCSLYLSPPKSLPETLSETLSESLSLSVCVFEFAGVFVLVMIQSSHLPMLSFA